MRQALSLALQNFSGAVILVSHDREMIATVCDELYLVHDGKCEVFDNDIAYYSAWLSETRKNQNKTAQNIEKENNQNVPRGTFNQNQEKSQK